MKRALVLMGAVGALTIVAFAADAAKVMDSASEVIENMSSSKEIPHSLLRHAKCVAVIPSLTKAGLIVGGEHGNGVISCRTSSGWSAPGFITMTGGSIGLQAGGEHKDIVLLMNEQGEEMLNKGHWDLGAEAVAAGPSGGAGGSEDTGWGKTPVLS
jgi:SH3 domain-containing YSC84-like protein 1